jgi:hypothetical protein
MPRGDAEQAKFVPWLRETLRSKDVDVRLRTLAQNLYFEQCVPTDETLTFDDTSVDVHLQRGSNLAGGKSIGANTVKFRWTCRGCSHVFKASLNHRCLEVVKKVLADESNATTVSHSTANCPHAGCGLSVLKPMPPAQLSLQVIRTSGYLIEMEHEADTPWVLTTPAPAAVQAANSRVLRPLEHGGQAAEVAGALAAVTVPLGSLADAADSDPPLDHSGGSGGGTDALAAEVAPPGGVITVVGIAVDYPEIAMPTASEIEDILSLGLLNLGSPATSVEALDTSSSATVEALPLNRMPGLSAEAEPDDSDAGESSQTLMPVAETSVNDAERDSNDGDAGEESGSVAGEEQASDQHSDSESCAPPTPGSPPRQPTDDEEDDACSSVRQTARYEARRGSA